MTGLGGGRAESLQLFHITDDLYRLLDQPPNALFEQKEPLWITPEPKMPIVELTYHLRDWSQGALLTGALGPPPGPAKPIDDGRSAAPTLQAWRPPGSLALFFANPNGMTGVICRGRIRFKDDRPRANGSPKNVRDDRFGFEHMLIELDAKRDTPTVRIDFGGHIAGGVLEAVAHLYVFLPLPFLTARFRLKILGRNPTKDAIRKEIGRQAALAGLGARVLDLWVICFLESRFRQFETHGDRRGEPLWNKPSGYGVMQLDPASSAEQLWNWRENIKGGIRVYQDKLGQALIFMNRLRKKYPLAPPFTAREVRMEVFQLYNGGQFWGSWDGAQWQSIAGQTYAYRAERVRESVDKGVPPAEWND